MTATLDDEVADLRRTIAELQQTLAECTAELRVQKDDRDDSEAQQAAIGEIMDIINSSLGNPVPVFEAILERAMRLCGAAFGQLGIYDGERFHTAAQRGVPTAYVAYRKQNPPKYGPGTMPQRILEGERVVHVADLKEEDAYRVGEPNRRALVDLGEARTSLAVALAKNETVLGYLNIYRTEVRPFSGKQTRLLENFAAQAVVAMENARLLGELRQQTGDLEESLEYQTATSGVLKVISSSRFDVQPVFETIVATATRLCDAEFALITRREGAAYRVAATFSFSPELHALFHHRLLPANRESMTGRIALGGQVVHIDDIASDPEYALSETVTVGGARTMVGVPLLRDGEVLGTINLARKRVLPFAQRQIDLVRTFADQAVIAIENARLLTETREALEQQTATSEVLQVINSSPGDLAPVFDAMLEKALRLSGSAFGILNVFDGQSFQGVAMRGVPPAFAEFRAGNPAGLGAGTAPARILAGENLVHNLDLMDEEAYRSGDPYRRAIVDLGGARSHLAVALRKDNALLGMLTVYRQEVRAFSGKEVALLQNFAAQAVIAIENARLLTETREALEQQTATAEVLQVINSSPGDLAPIFDAMLEKAMRLCESSFGALRRFDGKVFWFLAVRDASGAISEIPDEPIVPDPGSASLRIVQGESMIHIPDLVDTEEYRARVVSRVISVEKFGLRTAVWIALRKDDVLMGDLVVYRKEVRPFTDKQIALLQNFAAQAVIAMENARLLTETREALEQQTATAEVLQVINYSPGDLAPVFETILEKAHVLCAATHGSIGTYDDDCYFRTVATRGYPEPVAERLREGFAGYPVTRPLIDGAPFVHIPDLAEIDHPIPQAVAKVGGFHTGLFIPLRKDSRLLGHISAARAEVRPFSDKQIALLQNFAAQAVIAMENARLLTETREALEQQTATAEVLQVINSSPGDLAPVFEAMLEKATRLCEAVHGHLATFDGKFFRFVAVHGGGRMIEERQARGLLPPSFGVTWPRLLRGDSVVHVTDVMDTDLYRTGHQGARWFVDIGGGRTCLTIALRKEGALLGALTVYRREVRPFTDKQIALLENFAAQAVIAMENARLITETREALEQQTATAEVLQVINASPGNLAPVFDAMLERAMRLCEAAFGVLWIYDNDRYHAAAVHGAPPAFVDFLREPRLPPYHPSSGLGRMLSGEDLAIVNDMSAEEIYRSGDPLRRAIVDLAGARSAVTVSLRKDQTLLGAFTIYRQEVRPFSEKQIALLQNFSAQAVIAMENARLLDEIRQHQAELRVTFDNMADGVAMFDEDLRLAAWNRNFQQIADLSEDLLVERPSYADYLRILTGRGELDILRVDEELSRRIEHTEQELRLERTRPNGQVIEVRRNAVPDGGFVLIYSDITERKRSEAEIRAARDAAEAAYRDLKAAQASLVQAEKMASLGQLTAGIAHEIKNPLNFVNNFAGLSVELLDELKETAAPAITALDDEKRAEIDETIEMLTGNLEKIAEHGKRADNIVKSMLEHSRGSSGERWTVDFNALIEEALNLAYHGGRAQDQSFNITLERDYAEAMPPIELVPQDITRVCLNLFTNGFYATTKRQREGGDPNFKPTLKVSTRDLGDAVEVRIRDNGVGIPLGIKDKLFQPFFTTKPTGEGTGLGLSISYDIVTQQHGGTIEVDSRVGEFTEFTVRLPRTHRTTMAEAAS